MRGAVIGIEVPMLEEEDVFRAAGVPWTAPEDRVTVSDIARMAKTEGMVTL